MHGGTLLTITFAGRSFVLDGQAGADLVAAGMQAGHYEAPLPMLIMAVVARTAGLFLDIGANNGLYSILAAKTRDDAAVLAFEPYRPVADILRSNLRANNLTGRVEVHEIALSDDGGTIPLYTPDPGHGLVETSASLEANFKPGSAQIMVERARLDDLAVPGRVAVMKVDIEGHEAAFFRGARCLIERDRPIIFAEMLEGAEPSFPGVSAQFLALDYLLFRLRPSCVIAVDAIVYDPLAWNYGLIPREGLTIFANCCRTHGLDMFRLFDGLHPV